MQQLPSPYVHAMAPAPKVAVVGKIEIRQIINKWQRHRQYGFAPTKVAAPWIKMMDEFLKENAFLTKCYDVEGGRFQPCSCLSILQNEPYRQAVARYSVKFLQRPSDEQNQIIIDMQKDASAKSSERYPLPYDCGEMEEAVVALDQHRICRFAMGTITQMGSWRWNNNKRLSSTTGVAKEHGNVKKRRTKRSTTAQNHTKKQATTAATIEAATTTDVADDGTCTQLREYDVDDWRDNDQMEGHDETVDMAFHKSCSSEGCTNIARTGGVCVKHGAKVKLCSSEGCTNIVVKRGVCIRHGATLTRKECSSEGCTNQVRNGGVCERHGSSRTPCDGSTAFGSEYEKTTATLSLPNQSTAGASDESSTGVPGEVVICQEIEEV